MKKLFISGSISTKDIPEEVVNAVDKSQKSSQLIIVGDAPGVDENIQDLLKVDQYKNVVVYHIGTTPRNKADREWKNVSVQIDLSDNKLYKNGKFTRQAQMEKDKAMAKLADFGLVIWQDTRINRFGKKEVSKGSLHNIYNLLSEGKIVGLFYVPRSEKGIMKFFDLETFENTVINELVEAETKQYYYKMKKEEEKKVISSIENSMIYEEIALFYEN